ncbi:MAG TPA: hypothetical protein VKG80_08570 [Trebonia sp.]|nr:hypothetical protein [Trebonia sp.]
MNRPGYQPASASARAASSAGCQVQTLAIPVATTSRSVADSSGSSASRSAVAFTPGIQTEPNPACSIPRAYAAGSRPIRAGGGI